MPLGEQRTNLILIAGALVLALLAGVMIPLSSGSQPGQKPSPWTPPTPTSPPTARPATPTVRLPAATVALTRAPATPMPTQTALPTTPVPSPTPSPSSTPPQFTATRPAPGQSATPTASSVAGAPVATVRQGPLILRVWPGKDYAVVALGNVGDAFTAVGRTADGVWLKVCCIKDAPVWLAAEFVEVAGNVDGLPIGP